MAVVCPAVRIAEDVRLAVQTQTGFTLERRITPYLDKSAVVSGKWIVVAAGDEQEVAARQVDKTTLTVDIAYQEALPQKSDTIPDPLEDTTWFDGVMNKVETVKNLFRGEGALRDGEFDPNNEFYFLSMVNTPIYRPDLMMDYQIFTSVIRLTFIGEIEAT